MTGVSLVLAGPHMESSTIPRLLTGGEVGAGCVSKCAPIDIELAVSVSGAGGAGGNEEEGGSNEEEGGGKEGCMVGRAD